MKVTLGKDMPYSNLGSFRRARRSEEKSQTYLQARQDVTAIHNLQRVKNSAIIKSEDLLPNYQQATIPERKFTEYALSYDKQPDKAKAFELALGYTLKNADHLIENIKKNLSYFKAVEKSPGEFGKRYEVMMTIKGANGKYANIKTGWLLDKRTEEIRLTSIYITSKKFKEEKDNDSRNKDV